MVVLNENVFKITHAYSYLCKYAISIVLLSFLIKISIPLLSVCRRNAVVYQLVTLFFHCYSHLFCIVCAFYSLFSSAVKGLTSWNCN